MSFGSGDATNLFGGDTNAASDVVVREVGAGATVLAARTTAGVQANGTTERSAMSADGRSVAFEAPAGTTNLAPSDADARGNDIFVRNLAAGTLAAATDPTRTTGSSFPDISGDGRYVVFETGERYDPVNDPDAAQRRLPARHGHRRVHAGLRQGRGGGVGNGAGTRPAISADGVRVAFTSASTNLIATDTNAATDVYTRDPAAQGTRLASVNGTTQGTNPSDHAAIAANGSLVGFIFDDAAAVTKLISDRRQQPAGRLRQGAHAQRRDAPRPRALRPGAGPLADRLAGAGGRVGE